MIRAHCSEHPTMSIGTPLSPSASGAMRGLPAAPSLRAPNSLQA